MKKFYARTLPALLSAMIAIVANAQFPYTETFKTSSAPGIVFGGTPTAFLTAPGTDANGKGYLRFTSATTYQKSFIYSTQTFPSTYGINIEFEYYTYGGNGADGITFFLFDATAISTFNVGGFGGSLGYAPVILNGDTLPGLSKGYIGIGIDEFGNFSNPTEGRQGGPGRIANSVTLRGAGNGKTLVSTNYPYLTTAAVSSLTGGSRTDTTSSAAGYRKAYISLTPRTGGGFTVTVKIQKGSTITTVINSYAYTTAAPAKFAFGLGSSTGGSTNFHEIRNLTVDVPDYTVLLPPTAVADNATTCQNVPVNIDVTNNDIITNAGGDFNNASIDLDPSTTGVQTTRTVTGGTFTVNTTTGIVTFTPTSTFTGTASTTYTVKDNYGAAASNSATVTVTVQTAISGNTLTAPATTTFCGTGNAAVITGATPTGGTGTYTYQWQSSTDNNTFTNLSGATSASYDPPSAGQTLYYRRVVTSGTCTSTSSSVAIVIQPPVSVNTVTAPATTTFCSSGSPGAITGSTPAGGSGTYTYQWQTSTDGNSYSNVSGATAISYTAGTLSPAGSYYYRRLVTSGSCTTPDTSNNVTFTVQSTLANNGVTAPATSTFCGSGDAAVITASTPTGGSGTYTYQWQSSADSITFNNISGATAAAYDPPNSSVTTYYRRVVSSGACTGNNSNAIGIRIQSTTANNSITAPAAATLCGSGDPGQIDGSTPTGGSGTYTYQWQSSADGTTFTNVSGATAASYDPAVLTATTYFRRQVTSGSCSTPNSSNVITITVQPSLAGNTVTAPATTAFCSSGDPANIVGATPTGGSGTYVYQWQSSTDGTTFTSLSSANGISYDPPSVSVTTYYRRQVTSGSCTSPSNSNVITVTIQPAVDNNTVTAPAASIFCGSGDAAVITATTPTGGSGTYTYQWQSSTDGTSFSNISGATAATYDPPVASATTYYRRQVTSGSCTAPNNSNAVVITIQPSVSNNTINVPSPSAFCGSGDAGVISGSTPTGGSGTYVYQWQSSADGTTFTNISGATAASYDPPATGNTTYYRRQVTSGSCSTPAVSNVVTITIESTIAGNTLTAPATTTFCGGGAAGTITGSTPTGGSGTYTYQWQGSNDGTNYSTISGATAKDYSPGTFNLPGIYYFRRLVTSGSCTTADASAAVSFIVQQQLSNNTATASATTTFCGSGDAAEITGSTPTGGSGTYTYQWQSSTDGSTYTNISGATAAGYDPPVASATTYYRRLVTSGACTTASTSNTIIITIESTVAGNTVTAPATTTFCASGTPGTIAGSTPAGGNGSYTYQWQLSTDGTTYNNITTGGTGKDYSPAQLTSAGTYYYRRLVTSGSCSVAAVSNAVVITVQAAIGNNTVTAPGATTFCASGDAVVITGSTPTGGSGAYTYQWQSAADGTTFSNISGATSAGYDPPAASATTYYRRLVTSGGCTTAAISNVVTITIQPALDNNVATAPAVTTFCASGDPAVITGSTPTGGSGDYVYQWQSSTDGTTFSNATGDAASASYDPPSIGVTTYYRRLVTSGSCSVASVSNVITVTVQAALANNTLTPPATTTFCGSGDAGVITGSAPTGGSGSYTYQWETSSDGASYSVISGATSLSYDPPAVSATTYFRRTVISGSCNSPLASSPVVITVQPVVGNNTITAPATTTFCASGDADVIGGSSPTGASGTYTYQWQSSTDGTTFSNISGATAATYDPAAVTVTTYFRRLVTSGSCNTPSVSNAVTITIQAAVDNNTVTAPATTTFCTSGDAGVITGSTPTGGSGTYTYQWQSSPDGTTWSNIIGATSASYDPLSATATTYYRRLVISGSCTVGNASNAVVITIQPAISNNSLTAPATTTFCAGGDPAVITGSTPAGGDGTSYAYQWQSSADGTTYTVISGATSASYDPPVITATTYYRRAVTSGSCASAVFSNVITITVQAALTNNNLTAPATTTFCASGDAAAITGSTPAGGDGATYTYQWQSSTDGTTFTNISGASAASYDPSSATVTTYYRRQVTSGSCTTPAVSNVVTITIQPAPGGNTVTAPATTTFCASGDAAVITGSTPTGGSGTYTYQWQNSTNGTTYTNIAGATSASYDPPSVSVTTYYRRLVTSGSCTVASNSNAVTITIQSALAGNTITAPATTTFCGSGTPAAIAGTTPTGGSGTYVYQWQSSADNSTFTNISGATSASYTPSAAVTQTTYYRRLVTSGSCTSASIGNVVTITVQPVVGGNTISISGDSVYCNSGTPNAINGSTPTGGSGTYTYQWQSSTDGNTYSNITTGGTSITYQPPTLATAGTYYYRRLVTSGACGTANVSNAVRFIVQASVTNNTINAPATNTFCASGDAGVITGSTPAGGGGAYVYQWQSSADNSTFTNISGATGVSYDPPAASAAVYYRRLVATSTCTSAAISNVITITVQPAIGNNTITPSGSTNFCGSGLSSGDVGSVPSGGDGSNYIYEWQYSLDGGTTYSASPGAGANSQSYTYTDPLTPGTYLVRRVVTSGVCTTPNASNTTTYTVQPPLAGNDITAPATTSFCSSVPASTVIAGNTPAGGSGTYTYQWQRSADNITFTDLTAPGSFSDSYTVPPGQTTTLYYRRGVTSGNCTTPIYSDTVLISVTPSPTTANAGNNQTLSNTTSTTLAGNTPSSGTGTWTQVSGPSSAVFANAGQNNTGVSGLTPGTYVFRWTIATAAPCAPSTSDVTVLIQTPPVAVNDNSGATTGVTENINVLANDIPGSGPFSAGVVITIVSGSTNGSTIVVNGTSIDYTSAASGGDNFSYTITDANGSVSNVATVSVNSNSLPTAVDDTASTIQGTPVPISVAGNDSDPDGTLNLATVTIVSPAAHGSLSVNASTGVVTYTPSPASYTGNDQFTYTINDNSGATSNVATVNIVVKGIPIVVADDTVTNINTTVIIPVLNNDTDPNNALNAGSVAITTPASGGTATANANGTVTYVPPTGASGTYTFAYTVTNNQGVTSAPATVTVRVNAAPVAVNDSAQTNAFTPVAFNLSGNDTDTDGSVDASSVAVTQQPSNGTAVTNGTGGITYTPNAGFYGRDTVRYTIGDNDNGISNVGLAIIKVNALPVANNDADTTNIDTPVTINVAANDTDADGTLNGSGIVIVNAPQHGTAVPGATPGTVVYTPASGYTGSDNFTYTITDNLGATSNAATVRVEVNAPPIALNDSAATGRNVPVVIDVTANDSDADVAVDKTTVTVVTSPQHGTYTVNGTTGAITYTSTGTFTGRDSLKYTVKDALGVPSSPATVYITVNAAPVANNDAATGNQGSAVVVNVLANDVAVSGAMLPATVNVVTPPSNGSTTLNTTTGAITYTPAPDYYGNDTFYYTVTDNNGLTSNAGQVIITVNAKPVANPDNAVVTLNGTTNVNVIGNDTDADGTIDPATVVIVANPANGTVTVLPNGTVTYAPNSNYAGSEQFSYNVKDNTGFVSNTVIVNITVNRPPVAVNDTLTTNVNTAAIVNVVANDSDPDGTLDLSSVSVVTNATNGVLVNNGNGTFTYTPAANFSGTDAFTYVVKDNNGAADTATVNVRVNRPPVAVNDTTVIVNSQATSINVLANDSDADGTLVPGSTAIVTAPQHGTAVVNTNGTIIYLPNSGFSGIDSIRYTVQDNNGAVSNIATVRIRLNAAPVAVNDTANTNRNTAITINVAGSDTDADGTVVPGSVAIVNLPANGTLSAGATPGTVVYSPASGFTGTDVFTYSIKDNDGAVSNTATVRVVVLAGPVTGSDNAATNQNQATDVNVLANDTDAESAIQPGTVTIVTPPAHGTATVNTTTGVITYTPATDYYGTDNFTYTVQDANGVVSPATTATIWINALPVTRPDTASVSSGGVITVPVIANDTDPDGTIDATSVTIVTPPAHGTATVNPTTGVVTYTPATGYYGVDSFVYTVKDNTGAFGAPATVIMGVNAAPVAVNDSAIVAQNVSKTITVLTNDSDVDGTVNTASVAVVTQPLHGSTSISNTGVITYIPATDYVGADSLYYTVKDNLGSVSNTAKVYLYVSGVPFATADSAVTNQNVAVTINVLANDTDAADDIDPTSSVIVTPPANGSVVPGSIPGTFIYTPNTGYTGGDNFTYRISDDVGITSDPATVYIKVNALPVAARDTITVNPETPAAVSVVDNDTDSDGTIDVGTVTVVTGALHGTYTVSNSGIITYTPAAGFSGPDSIGYTVEDNDRAVSNTAYMVVTILAAPLASGDTLLVNGGASNVLNITANDVSSGGTIDSSTIVIVTPPGHGTITVSPTGVVTYTPAAGYTGVDSFTYTVKDSRGSVSAPGKVILDVNAPPDANDDNATTVAGRAVVIPVLDNDADANGAIEPSGVTIVTPPSNGTVTVNPTTGAVTYTPNPGFTGSDNFSYKVTDSRGAVSVPAGVRITVNPLPSVNPDNANVTRDLPAVINVLRNDTAATGTLAPSTVTISTQPQHGTVTVNPTTGAVTYTPAAGYTGLDSFAYTVQSSDGTVSNPATVHLRVFNPPVVVNDSFFVNQGASIPMTFYGNDISPNGTLRPSMFIVIQYFRHGSQFVASDSSNVLYTPFAGYYGIDTGYYQIRDSVGALSNIGMATVTVNAIPVAVADNAKGPEGIPVTIDVTANDTDADGTVDKTTVTITTAPQHGTVAVDPVTGVITYTPDAGYSGTDHFNYTIKDNRGAVSAPANGGVTISVSAKPVATPDAVLVNQKDTLRADVTANDVAAGGAGAIDKTTVTIVTPPQHGTVTADPATGVISYVPASGYYGVDSFTYTVKDTLGAVSAPGKVSVTVNSLPIASDYAAGTVEGTPVTADVSGNDEDLDGTIDRSTVTVVIPPKHGTATVDSRGIITYTPAPGFIGVDTLGYNERDNDGGLSNTALVIISVDDMPVATSDTAVTKQNIAVAIDVPANDIDNGTGLNRASVTIVTTPAHGSAVINTTTGVVTYTPSPDFSGLDSFTYTIRDMSGVVSTPATVRITVNPIPVAGSDNAVIVEGAPATIDVTANDSSPAGIDKSTVIIVTQPQHGTVTVDAVTGVVTYTPQPGYTGPDNFSYTVKDSLGTVSAPSTVSVIVYSRPVVVADSAEVTQGTSVGVDVTANDTDASGTVNKGSVVITTQPQHGTVSVNNTTGVVTYTPAAGYYGTDTFRYTIADNNGAVSQPGNVVISVNARPVVNADSASVVVNGTVQIDVLANDAEPRGELNKATITITTAPAHGTVFADTATGLVRYTPVNGYVGTDSFAYTVRDIRGITSNPAQVSVTVSQRPVANTDGPLLTFQNIPVSIPVLDNDVSADHAMVPSSVTIVVPPAHGTVTVDTVTGRVTYTPAPGYTGTDSFRYTAMNTNGVVSLPGLVPVTVNGYPVANPDSVSTNPGKSVAIDVMFNDAPYAHVSLDRSSVTITTPPAHGTATVNALGVVTYTPAAGFNGTDVFYYTMKDSAGGVSNAGLITVTVNAVNVPPVAVADSLSTNINTVVIIDVTANDIIAGTAIDSSSLAIETLPGHGTVSTGVATGRVVYTPAPGFTGVDSFTYRFRDKNGLLSNTAAVYVTVVASNAGPAANTDQAQTVPGVPVTVDVTANDVATPGTVLVKSSVTISGAPVHGSVTIDSPGRITYTPAAGYNGADYFSYTVKDNNGVTSNAALVFISINIPPVAVNDTAYTTVNVSRRIPVANNDYDRDGTIDRRSVAVTTAPVHGTATVDAATGNIVYVPATGFVGVDSVRYIIRDNSGSASNLATVIIRISAANTAPVAVNDNVATPKNTPRVYNVTANDTDIDGTIDVKTVTIVSQPAHGTVAVNAVTGIVTYTPAADYTGADVFTYTVKDNLGTVSNVATVNMQVNENNQAPVANADVVIGIMNLPVSFTVTGNDVDPDGNIDTSTIIVTRQPRFGTLALDSVSGRFTYTPGYFYVGTDDFMYTVKDNSGYVSNSALVTLIIQPENEGPKTRADSAATAVNTPVTMNVTANDVDVDGNLIYSTLTVTRQPQHGSVSVNNITGLVTYTPATGYVGLDSIWYTIEDNSGSLSAVTPVIIRVGLVPPVAVNDQARTTVNIPVTINVTANDTDADGTILPNTVVITRGAEFGVASVALNGNVVYTPRADFVGLDSFRYVVKDNSLNVSNVAAVYVTVGEVVIPPIARADSAATTRNTPVAIDVTANDTDPDGSLNKTTVTVTATPAHGTATVNTTTGVITYAPAAGYSGADSLKYTVKDDKGNTSNVTTVYISITVPNAAPVANADTATTLANTAVSTDVTNNDTDSDGTVDKATVTITTQPQHGVVTVNSTTGVVTYTPTGGYSGVDSFKYTVKDNQGLVSNVAVAQITIGVANQPPVAVPDTVRTNNGTAVTIDVTVNDRDVDGSIAKGTVTITTQPLHGVVTVNSTTGVVTYTPVASYSGVDSFKYTVKDNNGNVSNTAVVNITVGVANAAPVAVKDSAAVGLGSSVTIDVTANDTDSDGTINKASVSVTVLPAHGTVTINPANGQVTYTPAAGYTGKDSFSYTIRDNGGAVSNTAVVAITVNPVSGIALAKALVSATKTVTGAYDITYVFTVTNTGNDTLRNVQITDNLNNAFTGVTSFTVKSLTASGLLGANSLFNGAGNINLLTGNGQLLPGRTDSINLVVTVVPGAEGGTFNNTATASATGRNNTPVTDQSVNGRDPQASGNSSTPVVLSKPVVDIPNGFSPNNDGVNDRFVIQNLNNRKVRLEVYNRWGNLVFKDLSYNNTWDGECNQGVRFGNKLPDGTYFYVVMIDGGEKYVGYVTIKR